MLPVRDQLSDSTMACGPSGMGVTHHAMGLFASSLLDCVLPPVNITVVLTRILF